MKRILVTGGAGFLGSNIIDRIIKDYDIVVLDNLSAGSKDNLSEHRTSNRFSFINGTILDKDIISKALKDVDTVFHFAAQPDVRISYEDPIFDFEVNMIGGMNLLEAMRKCDVSRILFASSGGTVYGDIDIFPTPESIALRPVSNYGAAKASFEMYLSSYSNLYDFSSVAMRLSNLLGPRLTHGVIYDFFMKLKRDSSNLEVLGTGEQEKSFMYVSNTAEASLILANKMEKGFIPINVSSGERLKVSRIAELVIKSLELDDTSIEYTGSKRGWTGDVAFTDLDIDLLRSYGWKPRVSLEEGVRLYINWLVDEFGPIN